MSSGLSCLNNRSYSTDAVYHSDPLEIIDEDNRDLLGVSSIIDGMSKHRIQLRELAGLSKFEVADDALPCHESGSDHNEEEGDAL